jgi:hypothetical protein
MAEAVTKLGGVFADHASVTITYSRGASGVGGIPATIGRTFNEISDGQVIVASESRDYILAAALLVIDGALITPRNGDRITEQSGKVYEVTAPKPLDCFETIGPTDEVIKIHTKGPI